MKIRTRAATDFPWSWALHAEGARSASTRAAVGPLPPSFHARRQFSGQPRRKALALDQRPGTTCQLGGELYECAAIPLPST
jgi:hypothetical protein